MPENISLIERVLATSIVGMIMIGGAALHNHEVENPTEEGVVRVEAPTPLPIQPLGAIAVTEPAAVEPALPAEPPAEPAPAALPTPEPAAHASAQPKLEESASKPSTTEVSVAMQGPSLGVFEATCYAENGSTASGSPAGPGSIAVDPTVIPMGTHLRVEGYGDGVAVDTGLKIKGRIIDIWKPTEQECLNWGHQTVQVWQE